MGLPKGRTNNKKGRPKGKPNKVTASTKDWIQNIINSSREQLENDLMALDPRDRWTVCEKLLGYIIPKQQANTSKIDFSKLDDNQLELIINDLTEKVK